MAGATFSDEILQTVSGTTTAWLPLTSPWISIAACSSQLYEEPNLGPVVAFDPFYYSVFASDQIPCLPPEFTSWWEQQSDSGKTVYALGPTFVCPAAYTALQTILVNSATQQVLCCPAQYTLLAPVLENPPTGFPSQCYSSPTSGEVITYMTQSDQNGTWSPFTRGIQVDAFLIYALPVNGYNVIATTTNPSSSTPTTISAGSATITPPPNTSSALPTSAPNNTTTASGSTSTGLSAGAAAGVGIGAAAGLILVAILGWYLYKRRKSAAMSHEPAVSAESNVQPPMAAFPSGSIQPHELPHKHSPTPYEIG